jgi:hypothetical protein
MTVSLTGMAMSRRLRHRIGLTSGVMGISRMGILYTDELESTPHGEMASDCSIDLSFFCCCSASQCWMVSCFFISHLFSFSCSCSSFSASSNLDSRSKISCPCRDARTQGGLSITFMLSAVLIQAFDARVVRIGSGRMTTAVYELGE